MDSHNVMDILESANSAYLGLDRVFKDIESAKRIDQALN